MSLENYNERFKAMEEQKAMLKLFVKNCFNENDFEYSEESKETKLKIGGAQKILKLFRYTYKFIYDPLKFDDGAYCLRCEARIIDPFTMENEESYLANDFYIATNFSRVSAREDSEASIVKITGSCKAIAKEGALVEVVISHFALRDFLTGFD